MNIMIDIECSDIGELKSHLQCLLIQIRKQQNVSKLTDKDEFVEGIQFVDNNCYGTHELNVIEFIKSKK